MDLVGTSVLLKPGIISGGPVSHECPLSRSVGYYLEPILLIAPFAKKPLLLTLRGVTTNDEDLSVSKLCAAPKNSATLELNSHPHLPG
jgi:RNA 3'-terminal phosphate cyclase-like protein